MYPEKHSTKTLIREQQKTTTTTTKFCFASMRIWETISNTSIFMIQRIPIGNDQNKLQPRLTSTSPIKSRRRKLFYCLHYHCRQMHFVTKTLIWFKQFLSRKLSLHDTVLNIFRSWRVENTANVELMQWWLQIWNYYILPFFWSC